MTNESERWDLVGKAIGDRVEFLSLTAAEVKRAGGISWVTLNGYRSGKPIKRADKKRELCKVLGWELGSIDALLNGRAPILVGATPLVVVEKTWEERVEDLERTVREHAVQLARMAPRRD